MGLLYNRSIRYMVHLKTSTPLHLFTFPTPAHLQFDTNFYFLITPKT
jgi:hypothetical protein